jgi:hypothetical protein
MPPRAVTLAVLLFWLATTGWMVYRDQVVETDLPPVFKFDLADEVTKGKAADWEVYFQDRLLQDRWHTGLNRDPDAKGQFVLSCSYLNREKRLHLAGLSVSDLSFQYRANRRGEVVALQAKVLADEPGEPGKPGAQFWVEVRADREADDAWQLRPQGRGEPAVCRVPSARALFNPLHPSPAVAGLYPGQTWTVVALDPLENVRPGPHQGRYVKTARWHARVTSAELPRKLGSALCWRVDYTAEDGTLRARAWVARLGHMVLQQEVYYPEGTLKLVRVQEVRGRGRYLI